MDSLQSIWEKLQNHPNAKTELVAIEQGSEEALERLATYLQSAMISDPQFAADMQSEIVQVNQNGAIGYQVLVKGGVAYVGTHYQIDSNTLKPLLEKVLYRVFQKPVGIPQNLPRGGTPKFVGRDRELAMLHDQLQQNDRMAISSIQGMGGVGKTELVLQYGLKHLQSGTYGGGICWLRSREEIGIQIVEFARRQLNLEPPEKLELVGRVEYCWRHWREGEVLAIFDDVQDYRDVQPYLPPVESRFNVLMTTRFRLGASVREVELQVLEKDAALELLRAIVGIARIDVHLTDAEVLCEWLGYLPLGLELVGRYLARKPNMSLPSLLERLQGQKLEAQALSKVSAGMTAQQGVAAAFELSWKELSISAQELAGLLSLFAAAPIPWNLVERFYPEALLEDLENQRDEELISLHLLKHEKEDTYSVHPLVREFFSQKCKQQAMEYAKNGEKDILRLSYCLQMYLFTMQVQPGLPTKSATQQIEKVVPHIIEITTRENIQLWSNDSEEVHLTEPFFRLGVFFQGQAAYEKAETWYRRGLTAAQTYLGDDHAETADGLSHLAQICRIRGQYEEAKFFHKRSLAIQEKLFGKGCLESRSNQINLAELFRVQGRFDESESLYIQLLITFESRPDLSCVAQTSCMNNLAELYRTQGRYLDAEPLYKNSIKIREEHLGLNHPETAMVLNNLAELYRHQKKLNEAHSLYKRSLAILEENLGKNHPAVACILNNLGGIYHIQEEYATAEALYKRGLRIDEKCYGIDHLELAPTLNNLAELCKAQSRYAEAESFLQQVREILNQHVGTVHPDVAINLWNSADLYIKQKQYERAEPLLIDSLKIWEQLKYLNPQRVTSRIALARLHLNQNRQDEALSCISDVFEINLFEILENQLDSELFILISEIINSLTAHYYGQECYETAEVLLLKVIEFDRKWFKLDDSIQLEMSNHLGDLGAIYCIQHRLDDAENLLLEALKIQEMEIGSGHHDMAKIFYNLGAVSQLRGSFGKAESFFKKALKIWRKSFAPNHPNIVDTQELIDFVRKVQVAIHENIRNVAHSKKAKKGFGKP